MSVIKAILKDKGLSKADDTQGANAGAGGGNDAGAGGNDAGTGGGNDAGAGDDDKNKGAGAPNPPAGGNGNAPALPGDDDDISEEKLLAALAKKGHKFTSLEDLNKPAAAAPQLTEEEQRQQEQQRRDNIRQYALQSKKVTSTQFDNYVKDTSIPVVEMAFRLFKEERIAELREGGVPADALPDDKSLRNEFDEAHFQYADESDPKRKRHEKLLQELVDNHIAEKYANILELDEDYDNYQSTVVKRAAYGQMLDTVIGGLGETMDFEVPDENGNPIPFKYKLTPEVTKAIKELYGNDASFSIFGQNNVGKDVIAQAIKGSIIQKEFGKILSEVAIAYASHKLEALPKGRRGIPPVREETGGPGGEKKENKVIKAILNQAENKKILQTTKK